MSCHPHGGWNPEGAPQARKENLPNLRAEWYVLEEAKCLSTVLSVGPEFPLVEHKGNELTSGEMWHKWRVFLTRQHARNCPNLWGNLKMGGKPLWFNVVIL